MQKIIDVRRAIFADLDALFLLLERQFAEHRIEFDPTELQQAMNEMFVREGLGFFMIAHNGEQVVGIAAISFAWTLEHCGQAAWLDELYVLPEYRSRGIGGQLLDGVIAEVRRVGCRAIDLEIETDHSRAENLYVRRGFNRLSRRRWALGL